MTFAVSLIQRDQQEEWYRDLLRYRYKNPSPYEWLA
jgi:hypothetical protein